MEITNLNIKTLAGIVTFNSDIDRLKENVKAVYNQVDGLVIFDNGSNNIDELKKSLMEFKNIQFIESKENAGIAKALSEIMNYAITNSYDWVLSLDDDSVVMPGLVDEYLKYIDVVNVGILTCIISDRNHEVPQQKFLNGQEFQYISCTISSGSFMNVSAYKSTNGYDESLFIDWVDNDISYEFKLRGFETVKINFKGILCEISNTEIRKFLFRTVQINNYSPLRRYYRCRNEIIIADRYPQLYKKCPFIYNFIPTLIKILIYEKNKIKKISSILNGRRDAYYYLKQHNDNKRVNDNLVVQKVDKTPFHY